MWNLFQLSKWCPAVKPWEWLDNPDWYDYAITFMRIDNNLGQKRAKRGRK
jgi:hypothetical protein